MKFFKKLIGFVLISLGHFQLFTSSLQVKFFSKIIQAENNDAVAENLIQKGEITDFAYGESNEAIILTNRFDEKEISLEDLSHKPPPNVCLLKSDSKEILT